MSAARLSESISLLLVAPNGTRNIQQMMSGGAAGVSGMTLKFGVES
jgi:hypothetical protein